MCPTPTKYTCLWGLPTITTTYCHSGDDLVDYEDDVCANSFNIYRAFVHLFGPERAQLQLVERITQLEARHAALLAQLPPDVQERYKQRQAAAAAEPGSEKWVFPSPILDEEGYRERVGSSSSSSSSSDLDG